MSTIKDNLICWLKSHNWKLSNRVDYVICKRCGKEVGMMWEKISDE